MIFLKTSCLPTGAAGWYAECREADHAGGSAWFVFFFQDVQSIFSLGVQFLFKLGMHLQSFRQLQSGQSSGIRETVGEETGGCCFQGLCGFSCESEIFGTSFIYIYI